jgi:uncharacterized iron-regulated membrane protein
LDLNERQRRCCTGRIGQGLVRDGKRLVPRNGSDAWRRSSSPDKAAYQVRLRYPEDVTPGGRSRVIVDQYSGKVLFVEGSRTAPAGTRLVIANRALHTGDIFGLPSKAVMSLASLAAAFPALSGLAMWWKRTRTRRPVPVPSARSAAKI